jgi:hypothetical protein
MSEAACTTKETRDAEARAQRASQAAPADP